MNSVELAQQPRRDLSAPPTEAQPTSRELVEEMRTLWAQGVTAGVWDVLARHPGLDPDRAVLIDLVSEEFSQRRAAGEDLDYAAFTRGFPGFGASVRKILVARMFCDDYPNVFAEENAAPLWPVAGDFLEEFYLERELGRGSFSRVFLARQLDVADRLVVVKVSFLDSTEAEALGTLSHPNIVPILSLHRSEEEGWAVVCMPYHGTATLADVLGRLARRGALPGRAHALLDAIRETPLPAEPAREAGGPHARLHRGPYLDGALHLGKSLAEAVAYVHERKICHRDLKPANVLLTPDGRPLLFDFNLSSGPEGPEQEPGGSLPYMAPEQIRALLGEEGAPGIAREPSCDVFGLGVMLYQLLTGVHPFDAPPGGLSRREFARWLLERQQDGPVPVRQRNPQVGRGLARLLDRCLAAVPGRRPSARALADALSQSLTWPRRVARAARRRPALLATVALALLALLFAPFRHSAVPAERGTFEAGERAYQEGRYGDAVEHFTQAVTREGASPRTLFARGRALYRKGDFYPALQDFKTADGLGKDGKIKAALAACHVQPFVTPPRTDHESAIYWYTEAIKAGYAPARVYNNLGYSLARSGKTVEVRAALALALRADPNLQAAYYNRALLTLRASFPASGSAAPPTLAEAPGDVATARRFLRDAVADMARAIKLGPATADLYRDAARLYALAACLDPQFREQGLRHLEKAVALGQPGGPLRNDKLLCAGLGALPEFGKVLSRAAGTGPSPGPRVVCFLDPIAERADGR